MKISFSWGAFHLLPFYILSREYILQTQLLAGQSLSYFLFTLLYVLFIFFHENISHTWDVMFPAAIDDEFGHMMMAKFTMVDLADIERVKHHHVWPSHCRPGPPSWIWPSSRQSCRQHKHIMYEICSHASSCRASRSTILHWTAAVRKL